MEDWDAANQTCGQAGGQLALLDDKRANEICREKFTGKVWIGATDRAEEGEWRWIHGKQLSYTDWGKKKSTKKVNQKSQPNGGRKENCLGMFVSWGWVDRPWEASMPFLCQYSEMKACYVMK